MSKKLILSEHEMDEKVAELRKWINDQPQLPKNIGKKKFCVIKKSSAIK